MKDQSAITHGQKRRTSGPQMEPPWSTVSNAGTKDYLGREGAIVIAAAAALGGLLLGYDTSVVAGAILFVREHFHLSSVATETAVGIILAGAIVGASIAGRLADKMGRKPILVVSAVGFGIFAVLTGLANNLAVFLIGRFLIGVSVGIASILTPLYIAELAPSRIRGALVTLNQLAMEIGVATAYCVDYFFAKSSNWRAMFISGAVPSVVFLVALGFLPESPRWLVAHNRSSEALKILLRVERPAQARRYLSDLVQLVKEKQVAFRDLFASRFRIPLEIGIGLAIFQQITGVNTIIYYAPTILEMGGFKSAPNAILATALVGVVKLCATLFALLLLDRLGRRPLLLLGVAGMGTSLIFLGYFFGSGNPSRIGILFSMIAYLGSFSIGIGPIFWLLISEIYPTTVRGRAMSLASVTIWISDMLVTLTFLSLIGALGPRDSFWLYAAACWGAFAFSLKMVPETRGRTLEEIEKSWAHSH